MRVLALAGLVRPDHAAQIATYRVLNPAAASWNRVLFGELAKLDLDLDIVQFWPVRRKHVIQEGRVSYHYLPRLPWIDGFTSAIKRLRVAALVRALRPDVVHGIGSEHGYAWAAMGHGVPCAITIHGYLAVISQLVGHRSWLSERFLVREERRALLGAERVIAINGYMRQQFIAAGCQPERIAIVPNPLDPVFLHDTPMPVARDLDIVMVGTLHRLKNQHVALDLLTLLAREHGLRPKVVIVGTGTATADSQAYVAALRRQRDEAKLDNVEFVGRKTPAELARLYLQSRFLLHTSAFEADPTVVSEALSCGAVPIVNPVAGLAFRVREGVNGWHLAIGDRNVAASRLAQLLTATRQREEIAMRGQVEVRQERGPLSAAHATLAIYRELASGVHGREGDW